MIFNYLKLTVFILSVYFLNGCSDNNNQNESTLAASKPAKLLTIKESNLEQFLRYPATVKPQKSSDLSFEVSGIVKEVLVTESQRVNAGDVIAILDSRDIKESYNAALSQFNIADKEYQRMLKLMGTNAIAKNELDKRRSDKEVAETKLKTAKKALEDTTLKAPFSCLIAELNLKEKQVVQAGSTAVSIIADGLMEATINLPASVIATAKPQSASNTAAFVTFVFDPSNKLPAVFQEANLNADATSQTYQVKFAFKSPENLNILPGMNATVWFKDPTSTLNDKGLVQVPLSAIGIENEKTYVWKVTPDTGTVSKQIVTLEKSATENAIIKEGLVSGDVIVTAGIASLYEGIQVHAWSEKQ
ncbi:efflux RND transporter periplasmic adaptor subunit [Pseudoalteromonas marina]|uniref:Efflux RND transporter periplasmic adaptor subunit n=1 Tax=Pseudoalteromonas marina TaxID=267375 RepID=A0ABT9FEP7_9GAMM|nr:efflux RND transporter periplasmic adaptor subunit [Pseudoalteromonas marina]MDP2565253.1 efflux RND transporter periplasmic adaptor subunit [Pseudoalteromonas marina]